MPSSCRGERHAVQVLEGLRLQGLCVQSVVGGVVATVDGDLRD